MKRFVKHLLPLGALLAVAAMPIQASAAEPQNLDFNAVFKNDTNFTNQSNTYYSKLICKWANHSDLDCDDIISDLVNNCWKPNLPSWPGPDAPETPEVPDGDAPSVPEVPDTGAPEQPEVPDVTPPEQPDVPDVTPPEQPDVPDVTPPEVPEIPDSGENDGSVEDGELSAYAQQVVDLVNKERAAAGLPKLAANGKLSQIAVLKAEDMRDKNYFAHTSPTYGSAFDMMKQFGISYKSAGENIAKGQKTPESVMNGWMNSQGHKENILSANYTEIGVGYVTDNKGNTYWVQMFIRP